MVPIFLCSPFVSPNKSDKAENQWLKIIRMTKFVYLDRISIYHNARHDSILISFFSLSCQIRIIWEKKKRSSRSLVGNFHKHNAPVASASEWAESSPFCSAAERLGAHWVRIKTLEALFKWESCCCFAFFMDNKSANP